MTTARNRGKTRESSQTTIKGLFGLCPYRTDACDYDFPNRHFGHAQKWILINLWQRDANPKIVLIYLVTKEQSTVAAWTDEDEGLLRGYRVREYLRHNGGLLGVSGTSRLYLQPGEEVYAGIRARLQKLVTASTGLPEHATYFRLKYSFAKDPFGAPFMWIILLPINLLSWCISCLYHRKSETRWIEAGGGDLLVTNYALIQVAPGEQLRFPWHQLSVADLSYSPPGINFTWRYERYFLQTSTIDRLALVVMMRFLALGNRGDDLRVPDEFLIRARSLGKL